MNGSTAGNGLAVDGAWMVFGTEIVNSGLTKPERRALYADVALVQSEANGDFKEAAELLKLRIGGAQNLRNYVNTLMSGIVRANFEATNETILDDGADYILKAGESFWVTVGNAAVNIQHESEGVGVTLYPVNHEDEDPVTDVTWTWAEFEKEPV